MHHAHLGAMTCIMLQTIVAADSTTAIQLTKADGSTSVLTINTTTPYVVIPSQKSTTGQRYVCIDTNGNLVSSAVACVGT